MVPERKAKRRRFDRYVHLSFRTKMIISVILRHAAIKLYNLSDVMTLDSFQCPFHNISTKSHKVLLDA